MSEISHQKTPEHVSARLRHEWLISQITRFKDCSFSY